MMSLLKRSVANQQSRLTITIAALFSIFALGMGFFQFAFVPLSETKVIDVTIVGIIFASIIGGYRVAIPLSVIWTLVTYSNVDPAMVTWPMWATLIIRLIMNVSVVYLYDLFKKIYLRSPWNVYRAIFFTILLKNLLAAPIDHFYRGEGWLVLRGEQFIIEAALCMVFMSLIIKHLRQIHILNGVRKKGEKENGNESTAH